MKAERRVVTLGEVATVQSGFAFKSSQWTKTGVPVVKIANVKSGRIDLTSNQSFVSESDAEKAARFRLQHGDIVIGMTGYVGEVAQVRSNDHLLLNQRVGLIQIDESKADRQYLFHLMNGEGFRSQAKALAYGSAQPNISPSLLHSIEIELPSIEEQRAIAATLGALDDKIESNRRAQASGEQLLHAFVRSALATSSGNEGELSDYCVLVKKPARTSDLTGAENYIGLEHMPRSSLFLGSWGTAEDLGSNKSWFQTGDILFGKLRPYFKKVGFAPVDGVCSTDILVLRAKNAADSALVAAVAGSDELIDAVSAAATGTRMPRASWSDLAGWKLPILTADERQHLAYKTAPLIARLIALTHESLRLASLRDALLPELLSGRLRAPSEGIKA